MAVSPTINPVLQQSATIELFSHAGAPQSCIPNCPVKGMASEPSQGNSQVQGTQQYSIPTFLLPFGLIIHFTILCHTHLIYRNLSLCSDFKDPFQKLHGNSSMCPYQNAKS